MTDTTICLPVPELGGLPSPITWLISRYREKRSAAWIRELDKHARAVRYARTSAATLERAVPGSVARLDERSLDISDTLQCALAQTFGRFDKAPEDLKYGVNSLGFHPLRDESSRYMNLAWRRIIKEYRTQPA